MDGDSDEEHFHDIDSNLETAFNRIPTLYETESQDKEARESCVIDLRLPVSDEDLRPSLPDCNDERWSHDFFIAT